ncbi:metalloregulator ArsR/SmtB family transcription factor [Scandinavium manionii]|uniref:metalloregulator ArsR/SmtB family transcription factor n=1 Tax=Scandinavium manionii TaxID=2926520 RepID=UPI0013580D94|nr:metalloregulator ArsR/SmtB family transcription factor [Scandinavium manionii]MCS2149999.1 metalloregulator ArsR/SmtB family transcription factor [Scandinavium manionii]MCS2168312.1 metalloregulator ArsR/SmtB family transcription factor [Scandinavium manionii]
MRLPVQLFKVLSDDTRLAIIMLLRESGELCVCDICGATSESQPKISRHMAILRDSELVLDRREGKWVYYRLSPHMPAWAAETITTAWQCMRDDVREWLAKTGSAPC